jgi:hypothetical protein
MIAKSDGRQSSKQILEFFSDKNWPALEIMKYGV